MNFASSALLILSATWLAGSALGQFDPRMPAPVPEVSGPVMSVASVRYIEIKIGAGAPALPGKQYTVNYTGWLRNGKVFDSTYTRNQPFVFVQGRRMVIAGWELAFEGMKVGGKRRLFIPWQLAYGARGRPGPDPAHPGIPPKADLIFDIELVDVAEMQMPPNHPIANPARPGMTLPPGHLPLNPPPAEAKPAVPPAEKPGEAAQPPSSAPSSAAPATSAPQPEAKPATPPPAEQPQTETKPQ